MEENRWVSRHCLVRRKHIWVALSAAGVEQTFKLRLGITHKNQWCFASFEYVEEQIKFKSEICGE